MTLLHWWMHWFWVTAHIVVSLTSPIPSSSAKPEALALNSTTTPLTPVDNSTSDILTRLQQNYRIAKAIGIQPSVPPDSSSEAVVLTVTTDSPASGSRTLSVHVATAPPDNASGTIRSTSPSPIEPSNKTLSEPSENKTLPQTPGRIPGKKDTKITWEQAFSKPPKMKFENKTTTTSTTTTSTTTTASAPRTTMAPEDLTVMPLQVDKHDDKASDANAIRRIYPGLNRSGELLFGEETLEPRASVATAASILDAGVGDSTRLGRARGGGSFNSEFQRDQLSRDEHHSKSKQESIKDNNGANVAEIATITGSCLAVIVLLSTMGSLGFIMYRRRYLNPPQTLNSDKCSNPDSSGYIDESTIRDNSEEMYSLDNDSFLNSLEAMTIQNYWTDVKHTKL